MQLIYIAGFLVANDNHRPLVSVGVPVRNGGELLQQSLACLRSQSYENFEVIKSDNASDDPLVPETIKDFCQQDRRFRSFRQDRNIGIQKNFMFCLGEARGSYFFWHAYDDLRSPDFIEKTVRALDECQTATLAVPDIVFENMMVKKNVKHWPAPQQMTNASISQIARTLYATKPAWFYGMYRRDGLKAYFEQVLADYPHMYNADMQFLFRLILDREITGAPGCTFFQRTYRISGRDFDRTHDDAELLDIAAANFKLFKSKIDRSFSSPIDRARLRFAAIRFLSRKIIRVKRLAGCYLRQWPVVPQRAL